MNGSSKIVWIIGALVAAGAAYWYFGGASGSDAGGDASGDGTGDASDSSGVAPDAAPDAGIASGLSSLWATVQTSLGVTPKGIRNNNPGNLRYFAGIAWKGQTGDDGTGYAVFDTAEDGVRALGHQLRTDIGRGQNSVQLIIAGDPAQGFNGYAPASENNVPAYVADVAGRVGVNPNQPLDNGAIPALAQAMIIHEEGQDPYGIAAIAAWSTEP